MARLSEPSEEALKEWGGFLASLPDATRSMAEKLPPWELYRLKDGGQRVTIYSYSDDLTVTVTITGQFNLVLFDRNVFGINPDDLEPCDIPSENEIVGTAMTGEEVDENLDAVRAMVRPDLWELDEHGKAIWKGKGNAPDA